MLKEIYKQNRKTQNAKYALVSAKSFLKFKEWRAQIEMPLQKTETNFDKLRQVFWANDKVICHTWIDPITKFKFVFKLIVDEFYHNDFDELKNEPLYRYRYIQKNNSFGQYHNGDLIGAFNFSDRDYNWRLVTIDKKELYSNWHDPKLGKGRAYDDMLNRARQYTNAIIKSYQDYYYIGEISVFDCKENEIYCDSVGGLDSDYVINGLAFYEHLFHGALHFANDYKTQQVESYNQIKSKLLVTLTDAKIIKKSKWEIPRNNLCLRLSELIKNDLAKLRAIRQSIGGLIV